MSIKFFVRIVFFSLKIQLFLGVRKHHTNEMYSFIERKLRNKKMSSISLSISLILQASVSEGVSLEKTTTHSCLPPSILAR